MFFSVLHLAFAFVEFEIEDVWITYLPTNLNK